ncbi:tryptophan 7-halogenase [Puniceicoccaceae bacterium K14]|nr:tryptophan 7-halogenase [Puniceicoccaceae bacterium K14]
MKADVVVIGGGPAGAATAIACRRLGLHVIILEALEFPRARPGESLPPAVEPLLQHWGVESVLREYSWSRYEGIWSSWDGSMGFQRLGSDERGQWRGWHLPRGEFDMRLLEQACFLGAVLLQPCRALSVAIREGKIVGLQTSEGAIEAKFVVDASGGRHWLAGKLGLGVKKVSPLLLARFGYSKIGSLSVKANPVLQTDDMGWTWMTPIDKDRLAWTRMRFDGTLEAAGWSPGECGYDEGNEGNSLSADVTWRCVERSMGPGYCCVGDAAVVLDPLSSHGVLRALMSGFMAGQTIAKGGVRRAGKEKLFSEYRNWLSEWFQRDSFELKTLYRRLPNVASWLASA